MLPDFTKTKQKIRPRLDRFLEQQIENRRGISQMSTHRGMHEGDRLLVIRADGSREESELLDASARFEVDVTDPRDYAPESIRAKLEGVARELGDQQAEDAWKHIQRVVTETGNVFDASGRLFTAELVLELLEDYPLEFDLNKQPVFPSFVAGPDRVSQLETELRRLDEEPELAHLLRDLVERKRAEWRARESNRKLVD